MDAQELLVNGSTERQGAERLYACIINDGGVLVDTLLLEAKVGGQMAALVVASEEEEGVGIMDFKGPEVEDTFNAEVSTVNVVAEEQILRFNWIATNLEQLHQVVKLAVNITAYCDWGINLQKRGFGVKNLRARFYNEESLVLSKAALAIQMLL